MGRGLADGAKIRTTGRTTRLVFEADCRRRALNGRFGKFVTALGRWTASAV